MHLIFSEAVPNKSVVGKTFKNDMKLICDKLSKLSVDEVLNLQNKLNESGSVKNYVHVLLKLKDDFGFLKRPSFPVIIRYG